MPCSPSTKTFKWNCRWFRLHHWGRHSKDTEGSNIHIKRCLYLLFCPSGCSLIISILLPSEYRLSYALTIQCKCLKLLVRITARQSNSEWDSLGFSGSLGVGGTTTALDCGVGVGLRTSASTVFFSSSFALFGLHTTSVTTPSVFFSRVAACKTKCTQLVTVFCLLFQSCWMTARLQWLTES
jgi:hypothetical protein